MTNCRRCTRWRPLSDFQVTLHKPTGKEYLRRICIPCMNRTKAERHRKLTPVQKRDKLMKDREAQRAKRRQAGVPIRKVGLRHRGKGGYGGHWTGLT